MKKKIVYVSLVGMLLILTGAGSFLLGKQDNKLNALPKTGTQTSTSTSVPAVASAEEGFESKTIAVVNLDEGVSKNGRVVNYASEISRYPSDDFYSTSLEDAKRGLLTGDYGAYLVIPATFSENVESLNVKIQKAQITYSVSNQLKNTIKLEVKDEINEYTKQLNQSISYLYVDSILNEFQGTQSTISTVLLNNNQGNEALAMVEPADLLNFMNIPELKQPDAFVEAVDIEEEMSKNSDLLEGMIADYQAGLTTGQEGAADIVASGNQLSEDASAIFAQVGSTVIGKDSNGDFKYASEVGKTAAGLTTYLDGAAAWTGNITEKVTDQLPRIESALTSAKYYYDDSNGLSQYQQQVESLRDYYSGITITAEMGSVEATQFVPDIQPVTNAEGVVESINLVDSQGALIKNFSLQTQEIYPDITNLADVQTLYYFSAQDIIELIAEFRGNTKAELTGEPDTIVKDLSGNSLDMSDSATHEATITTSFPQYGPFNYFKDEATDLMVEDPEPEAGANRLNASLAALTEIKGLDLTNSSNPLNDNDRTKEVTKLQKDLEDNVVAPIKNETDNLNNNLSGKAADLSGQTTAYNQVVTSFDPFSFLDQSALQGNFSSMQGNNSSISGKTTDHISKMSESLLDTYLVYTDNQMKLLEEAQTATDKGTDKVTEGLSSAKDALGELMDENYTLLQPITTKLAYTKVGDVADQSVYQYIVSPITVSNQSDDNKVTPAERRTKETEQKVAAQAITEKKTNGNNLVIPFVGGFLLLALVALGIMVVLSRNKKNTQKW